MAQAERPEWEFPTRMEGLERLEAILLGERIQTSTTEIYIQRFNGPQADQRIRAAMSG